MTQPQRTINTTLPWDRGADEERRFRKIIAGTMMFFFVFCIIVPNIPIPEKKREQLEIMPPRLAKLVTKKPPPPPPPPPPKEEEKKEEKPKEEKKKKEKEEKKEKPKEKTAKQKAKAAIAVFDDLFELRDQQELKKLDAQQKTKTLGKDATKTERSLITSMAGSGSGGVAVAKASSGGGGNGSLAGISTTTVSSTIEDASTTKEKRKSKDGKSIRTTENIQLIFDRYKGSIYSLYRRALRDDPSIEGTLVLHLVISPSGDVTRCEVVSSELGNAALERKITLKVKRINFGAADVEVWDDTYPIDFIPS